MRAQVRVSGRAPRPWQVWRISPLGVELVRPADLTGVGPGTPIDVMLDLGGCTISFPSLRVAEATSERGRELVAIAWAAAHRPGGRGGDRTGEDRRAARWACDAEYLPTGIAPVRARYGDFVYFRVLDISSTGMRLETSLRNTFLVPGLRLRATCTFPTLGQVQLALDVVHARVLQREHKAVLSVGVRHAARRGGRAREVLGEYLLRFGAGATVEGLCAEGFRIPASSRALEFGHVRTEQEYAEVLRLRRTAYVHARKIGESTKDVDMADGFDARSRILVARHRGRVVGTMRMSFPASPTDRLAHETWVDLPAGLPPRDQLVELFKACTHPGYRGSDLFYALSRHAALTLVQSGRRWALVSATDALAPVYERFGFRRLGLAYVHPAMNLRHHLLLADMVRSLEGEMNPIFWNLMDGHAVWRFARACGVAPTHRWAPVRVQLLRLLRPAAVAVRWIHALRGRRRAAASRPGAAQRLGGEPAQAHG